VPELILKKFKIALKANQFLMADVLKSVSRYAKGEGNDYSNDPAQSGWHVGRNLNRQRSKQYVCGLLNLL
jgi:hypothetical protein